MKQLVISSLFSVLSFSSAIVPNILAQTTPTNTVPAIASYAKEIDRFTKRNPKARIFGDVSDATTDSPSKWREFKTRSALEKASTGDNMNQTALVWTRGGKLASADFSFTSPSGDWAHLVTYYFRPDGTLAKIEGQLNTFYGDISVVSDQYFDVNGKQIKSTRKFLDLTTKKPKKPGDFMDHPIPVFKTVAALPFYKLL